MSELVNDAVNHPSHYTNGSIECIDAIESSMSKEEFEGYLKGNVLKYLWRYKSKNSPVEDLKKAQWYLNKLLETVNKETKAQWYHNRLLETVNKEI